MKHSFSCLLVLFSLACTLAHGQQRFNANEFRQQAQRHIIKAARLSHEEAQKFFPLWDEMKEKQRCLAQQAQDLKRQCSKGDKEATEAVMKIADIEVQSAKVQQEYYKKLTKALPASKVMCAIQANDDFHRQMVQRMQQGGKGQQGGKAQPQQGKAPKKK